MNGIDSEHKITYHTFIGWGKPRTKEAEVELPVTNGYKSAVDETQTMR